MSAKANDTKVAHRMQGPVPWSLERLSAHARPLQCAGDLIALYGLVLVLLLIGGLKFTALEAKLLEPLVKSSPLLAWAYSILSLQGFSNLLGVVEIGTAALLALAPAFRLCGVAGGALAALTFFVTSSLLLTFPIWEESLGGFPALNQAGAFLIKGVTLLGVALSVLGRALAKKGKG